MKNEETVAELYFELFRQYAWLSSTAIGFVVILIQIDAVTLNLNITFSFISFILSTIGAIKGQEIIVDSMINKKEFYGVLKKIRAFCMLLLGLGLGCFIAEFISKQ